MVVFAYRSSYSPLKIAEAPTFPAQSIPRMTTGVSMPTVSFMHALFPTRRHFYGYGGHHPERVSFASSKMSAPRIFLYFSSPAKRLKIDFIPVGIHFMSKPRQGTLPACHYRREPCSIDATPKKRPDMRARKTWRITSEQKERKRERQKVKMKSSMQRSTSPDQPQPIPKHRCPQRKLQRRHSLHHQGSPECCSPHFQRRQRTWSCTVCVPSGPWPCTSSASCPRCPPQSCRSTTAR
ncbi:hypothetical protein BS50DRAFT_152163 [Corynespora cassiicola Philippines]|uniref:Uncharacterized protein n=1 Tax=Corynespora cassiicola Philippines TaxID=1448308 RepID=A0A2T2N7S6_CORCC|nr:hypothetical protein BS50DRAFT_152163 [Corynespora cassiicola Philippines]